FSPEKGRDAAEEVPYKIEVGAEAAAALGTNQPVRSLADFAPQDNATVGRVDARGGAADHDRAISSVAAQPGLQIRVFRRQSTSESAAEDLPCGHQAR